MKICPKCKQPLPLVGFERKLIIKGKNKGTSTVKEFYGKCSCKEKIK